MENAYVAVRADLVVLARTLFHIRPSMLDAGPKRLLLTAQAICDGKTTDRWGHHATPIVMKFCEYTAAANHPPLPWQELVEDSAFYDGEEGVSLRTGNRPLGTLERYEVDPAVITQVMDVKETSVKETADAAGLPEQFVQSLVSGEWPSISGFTLELLVKHLGQFDLNRLAENKSTNSDPASTQRSLRGIVGVLSCLTLLATAGIGWWWGQGDVSSAPVAPEIVGYWDYDGIDGQEVPNGLVLLPSSGSGLGVSWQWRLELRHHDQLPQRKRQLWPVELFREKRKVCVNYPNYPRYVGFIDMPGEVDDGLYQFGPCD